MRDAHSDSAAATTAAFASEFSRGVEALRANDVAAAIERLARAVDLDASDAQAQLQLGVALQAAGRHAEAVERFRQARSTSQGDDFAPYLHCAVSHLALGETEAALRAASEACRRAPKLATAHYAYGQAWAAAGEARRAEQAFAAAVQLDPNWADAWVNYGLARYRQGAVEDAKAAMRRALAADAAHSAALSNLGAFMRISGETEGAEQLLQEWVKRTPNAAGARLNLAADLLQEERAAEALALLEDAEPPSDIGALRHWRLEQALGLLQLGRRTEAREVLDELVRMGPGPALAPLLHWRFVLLALAEGDGARAVQEAERMEAALADMGPEGVPEHAVMARFDLAKFWSGQGAPSRAFAQWTEGHKLLARFQPLSREAHLAFVNASIESFSPERLRDGPRAANRDPAPVFVVGMPRSGTTLVEQILAAHRDVHGAGERVALSQAFAALGGQADSPSSARRIAGLAGESFDAAAVRYLSTLRELAPSARRIVDKMPGNFLYLGLVCLLLPGARIIHCTRDPRDIGLSIFTFRFHGAHGYAHDLGDLGWYIGQHSRLMAHWKAASPTPILTVRLSDWVSDFGATLSRVLAHLELPADENCARFYESESRVRTVSRAQVRQPVNARGLGRWKRYATELEPLIAELERAGALAAWRAADEAPMGRCLP